MESDTDDYTPPPPPDGWMETVNDAGESVWRLAHLEDRRRSREHWQREEFLLLKLSGLVSALEVH